MPVLFSEFFGQFALRCSPILFNKKSSQFEIAYRSCSFYIEGVSTPFKMGVILIISGKDKQKVVSLKDMF